MTELHYGAVLARIDEHMKGADEKLDQVLAQVQETNGRLRQAEMHIAVLRWAVYGGGTMVLGALGYIIQMHLK